MAGKGMSVFTNQGVDYTINDPNIAGEFSNSTAYEKGDRCYYQGNLYKFTSDHAAGAWNSGHVTQDSVGASMKALEETTGTIDETVSGLSDAVGTLEETVSGIGDHVDALEDTVLGIDAKLNSLVDIKESDGYIPFYVLYGDSITIKQTNGQTFTQYDQLRFYDADKELITHKSVAPEYGKVRTITYEGSGTAYFIGITPVGENEISYNVKNNNPAFMESLSERIDEVENEVAVIGGEVENCPKKEMFNRFNKATITAGKYISVTDGDLESDDGFFASDYIYIKDLTTVKVSKTHIFGWYNAAKEWLGHPDNMNSGSQDLTFTVPENAVYLRFSAYNQNLNTAQIGKNISRSNYIPYGTYELTGLKVHENQIARDGGGIIVDASGSGDYTSFTQAVKENLDTGISIYVKPGTYDIVSEYTAIWGSTAVNSMADSDSSIFEGFQFGVILRNRKIEFAPGAHLVCDWTGHTVDGTHRFSAIRVDTNVEIIGMDLDCTATFYAIHDDYGSSAPYTNIYRNCRVIGHNLTNVNCIGGGCSKYSRHIIENCYFDNNTASSTVVRYHNTNQAGAEPEIYVSDTYFGTYFKANYYGSQTSKMRAYVNNSYAKKIIKDRESSSFNVDNVLLYKWNNTETEGE